jgi:hypothetical protein
MELPEMVAALQHMMGSKGWTDVVRPALEKMRKNGMQQLVYGSDKPVDAVRGYVMAMDWVLSWDKRTDKLAGELMEALKEDSAQVQEGIGTIYSDKVE